MQLRISVPAATHEALIELAIKERRDVRSQAEVLLIEALHRRQLVTPDGLEHPVAVERLSA